MDYKTFKHINGKQIDISSENFEIRDIVNLLLDELQDGTIEKQVYKCTYIDGYETDSEPPKNMTGFELNMEIYFNKQTTRDYFEHLLTKRLDNIKQLELCLANSIDEE